MKFLIKYASRNRHREFLTALANIYSTIGNVEYLILASFDDDDSSMNNDRMKATLNAKPNLQYHFGPHESKISAINRDVNECSYDWDILINMSDDMVFVQNDWAKKMERLIRQKVPHGTDFFAHFNDGYLADKLPTMSIMGREYYNHFGYIYHPDYKSFSCDAEAFYVAKMLYKWFYFHDVLFKHEHPCYTGVKNDETYERNTKWSDHDVNVYFNRMTTYFDVPNPPANIKRLLNNELAKWRAAA